MGREEEDLKNKFLVTAIIILAMVASVALGACSRTTSNKLSVVTSTSLLEYIVRQVGGDKVEVTNLVPAAQHPGDFDASPNDIQKVVNADMLLLHGWPGEKYADKMVAAANNPGLSVIKIELQGNWMTPPLQTQAADKVAEILSQADSQNAAAYQKAAEEYKQRVAAKEAEIKAKLAQANMATVNVLCAEQQAGQLKWFGLNVVATYGTPDTLTPQKVQELVDQGNQSNVTLVVDNLHSGKDAGAAIAEELGAKRIILLNFPGGFDNTGTWEKAIDYNVTQIIQAINS